MPITHLQQKKEAKEKNYKMKNVLVACFIIFFVSCKQESYRFAILEYSVSDINHSVKIEDPVKLNVLQNGISLLKQESIVIPIVYDLTIGLQNGDTLKYWGNGSVMMDSTRRYYIPKGKAQKDFIELLKSTAPGMKVDEDPGGF
jgi:hypothetical protein